MSRRPDWASYEPTPEQMDAALCSLIDRNEEAFGMFDAELTADTDRSHSEYFGAISGLELRQIQYSADATAEQRNAACVEIRRRLADAVLEVTRSVATKAAIKAWPDDERARLEEA